MVEINYDLIPIEKVQDTGEHAVKNAFYMRDEDEREYSELYRGYHNYDYFGFSVLSRVPVSEESTPQNK